MILFLKNWGSPDRNQNLTRTKFSLKDKFYTVTGLESQLITIVYFMHIAGGLGIPPTIFGEGRESVTPIFVII